MAWRNWRLGFLVTLLLSLLVTGASWVAGADHRIMIATFCASAITHLTAFLKDHPIDKIQFDLTINEAPREEKK